MTTIINGYQLANEFQKKLKQDLLDHPMDKKIVIAAILFVEDKGSQLYTQLKKEMAESLGIEYQVFSFSVLDEKQQIISKIRELNSDPEVVGIIIQKPWRKTWISAHDLAKEEFNIWWHDLVSVLDTSKDVDGLHPSNLKALKLGDWRDQGRVLPATCQATIRLLEKSFLTEHLFSNLRENKLKTIIIGKSDLLGQPLFAILSSKGCSVEMIGSRELKTRIEQKIFLKDADIVVTATGRKNLINGEMIKQGSVLIDVGEPNGDIDQASVMNIAGAVTPVPGGVGPMTVISLMENAIFLGRIRGL
jgi:methylenetetrahydrofolate dehydrogenase (NADP+) / methenyltetrahydrofolate cyclohydrolase